MSRLSRGRIYALFIGYLIFSSWFQLVAHTQTAISLFLLAVIGFFLDRLTDQASRKPAHGALPARRGSADTQRHPVEGDSSSRTLDPLISRAHSAIELLQALTSSSSSGLNGEEEEEEEEEDDDDDTDFERARQPAGDARRRPTARRKKQLAGIRQVGSGAPVGQLKPLTSPSGSASSGSASTGYNSDSRSARAVITD